MQLSSFFSKKSITQIRNFIWTGLLSTIFDIVILTVFVEIFMFNVLMATFFSAIITALFNYLLNIKFVFTGNKFSKSNEIFMFILLAIVGIFFNLLFMWVFYSILGLWYIFSRILTAGSKFVLNFIIKKHLIFGD